MGSKQLTQHAHLAWIHTVRLVNEDHIVVVFPSQAHKNVFLEEKVQVLQQQNEDLRARIDNNLVLSR